MTTDTSTNMDDNFDDFMDDVDLFDGLTEGSLTQDGVWTPGVGDGIRGTLEGVSFRESDDTEDFYVIYIKLDNKCHAEDAKKQAITLEKGETCCFVATKVLLPIVNLPAGTKIAIKYLGDVQKKGSKNAAYKNYKFKYQKPEGAQASTPQIPAIDVNALGGLVSGLMGMLSPKS